MTSLTPSSLSRASTGRPRADMASVGSLELTRSLGFLCGSPIGLSRSGEGGSAGGCLPWPQSLAQQWLAEVGEQGRHTGWARDSL